MRRRPLPLGGLWIAGAAASIFCLPTGSALAAAQGVGQVVVTLQAISKGGPATVRQAACNLGESIGAQDLGCAPPPSGLGLSQHRLTKIIDDGFGDKANYWVTNSGIVWNGYLYMGVGGGLVLGTGDIQQAKGGMIVRTADGETWETVVERGFNDDPYNMFVLELTEFDGHLYAATLNGKTGGQIWRTANGTDWEPVVTDGFGHIDNWAITDTEVYDGYLYAGTWRVIETSDCCGTELWRTRDPNEGWELVTQGFGEGYVNSDVARMLVHEGILYIAVENWTNGMRLFRSYDGVTFEVLDAGGFGNPTNVNAEGLIAYKGYLYVGTWNNGGPKIYRAPIPGDPGTWEPAGDWGLFFTTSFSMRFHRFGDYLFASVTNSVGEGAALYRTHDGENWEITMREGFADRFGNSGTSAHTIFNGSMYMGTYNREGQPGSTGTQVWRMDPPQNDLDNDAIALVRDNCPTVFNPDQRDLDGDGVGAACDCDDTDPASPGAAEGCAPCTDSDGDTFSPEGGACGPVDCDDGDSAVHPGAADPCDGVDQNCDGADGVDADQDGWGAGCPVIDCELFHCRPDCNDANPDINPAATEIPANGIDDNCNGNVDICGFVPEGERAATRAVYTLYALAGLALYAGVWTWRRRKERA